MWRFVVRGDADRERGVIIIYNTTGLLVGLIGVVLGIGLAVLTGVLTLGLITIAAVWIAGGLWLRGRPLPGGGRRPFPSIFFIPTPFLAALPLGLAVITGVVEVAGRDRLNDPRGQTLRQVEAAFRTQSVSGDTELAMAVHKAIAGGNFAGTIPSDVSVHAQTSPSAVLVVVKINNLNKFSSTARMAVLENISQAVKDSPAHADKTGYFAVKGQFSYGALRTPRGTVLKTTSSDDLFPFFGPDPRAAKP